VGLRFLEEGGAVTSILSKWNAGQPEMKTNISFRRDKRGEYQGVFKCLLLAH